MVSVVADSATPWTVAHEDPLSMEFSRQEYWGGMPFPPPRDLPNPGIEPMFPALEGGFFTSEPPWKPSGLFSRSCFNVNFLNPYCLLICVIAFFSLSFCLPVFHFLSVLGCPWKPCPSSTLLSIACPMSLCIDLFSASLPSARDFSSQTSAKDDSQVFLYKINHIHKREIMLYV